MSSTPCLSLLSVKLEKTRFGISSHQGETRSTRRGSEPRTKRAMMTSEDHSQTTSGDGVQARKHKMVMVRRHTTIDQEYAAPTVNHVSFFCGLAAGVAQAGLFNPIDRALYLSVKNRVPFLRWDNFLNPYQGFFQSVGHRALSGGLYYPLEQFFMTLIPPTNLQDQLDGTAPSGAFYNFLAGTAAGTANALIVNPVSAIKYKTWSRDVNRGMLFEAQEMFRKGGIRPFCNGMIPTVLRDLVFGGCYTFVRLELQFRFQLTSDYQWMANMSAAALATILSGPFNLARNVQYSTRSVHVAQTVAEVLITLVGETKEQPTIFLKWRHIQNRLRIGWGTARVAVGMAFGHYVYDKLQGKFCELHRDLFFEE